MPLSTIADGHADGAELCLLVALILFTVAFVMRVMARAVDGALIAAGFAFVALAWLVL